MRQECTAGFFTRRCLWVCLAAFLKKQSNPKAAKSQGTSWSGLPAIGLYPSSTKRPMWSSLPWSMQRQLQASCLHQAYEAYQAMRFPSFPSSEKHTAYLFDLCGGLKNMAPEKHSSWTRPRKQHQHRTSPDHAPLPATVLCFSAKATRSTRRKESLMWCFLSCQGLDTFPAQTHLPSCKYLKPSFS